MLARIKTNAFDASIGSSGDPGAPYTFPDQDIQTLWMTVPGDQNKCPRPPK